MKDLTKELATQSWFGDVSSRLSRFLSYGANWNGYGERPISEHAVRRAMIVLHRIALGGPAPVVVPVPDGGIQFEWYYSGTEVEVEVPPSGPVSVYLKRPDGDIREEVVRQMASPIWNDLQTTIAGLKTA